MFSLDLVQPKPQKWAPRALAETLCVWIEEQEREFLRLRESGKSPIFLFLKMVSPFSSTLVFKQSYSSSVGMKAKGLREGRNFLL